MYNTRTYGHMIGWLVVGRVRTRALPISLSITILQRVAQRPRVDLVQTADDELGA